ncbi:MAG: hypothetical protein JKY29_14265 [Gammaproteobacteria bacterium]|nr:hypothetical protein [Gammaproteobacteria bacterium]
MAVLRGLVSDQEFEKAIDRDDEVGRGSNRLVFAVLGTSEYVIKESKQAFHYSNFVEWLVWGAVSEMKEDILGNAPNEEMAGKFAECVAISHSARYLMMERLSPISSSAQLQLSNFPQWLNDKKLSAFGTSPDGSVKVMDYGMVDFYQVLNPLNHQSFP